MSFKKFLEIFDMTDRFYQTFGDVKEASFEAALCSKGVSEQELRRRNENGEGIFFTPNRFMNKRLKTELKAIDYLFADFDKGTKEEMRAKIYSSPIVPSLIIE